MLTIFAAVVAAMSPCPIENAEYSLRGASNVKAYFKRVDRTSDWPSGLAFATHFENTGRTYWWLPWRGGTDGRQHLASTTNVITREWRPPSPDGGPRPLGDIDYIATDAGYNVASVSPQQGKTGPHHILLPQLSDVISHNTKVDSRDYASTQFFDLVDCK